MDGDSGQGDYGLGRLGLVLCCFWPAYKSQLSRTLRPYCRMTLSKFLSRRTTSTCHVYSHATSLYQYHYLHVVSLAPEPWCPSVQSSSSSSAATVLELEMPGRRQSTPLANVGGVSSASIGLSKTRLRFTMTVSTADGQSSMPVR